MTESRPGDEPMPVEESISISELRRHTARYVSMAKSGTRVPITVRGEVVAYLVPAHEPT